MTSVKDIAKCIGLNGSFSIVRDFYGYLVAPRPLSLTNQVRLLKVKHIHLNLIRVGSESLTSADEQRIDAAVQFARDTYATVAIGIGRVQRWDITTANANGRDNIDSDDEAGALTEEWSVPNSAHDVFFVRTYAGNTRGRSDVKGSCDKDAKSMTGSVVSIQDPSVNTGFYLAHEIGHYLGLDMDFDDNHNPDPNNLMFFSAPNGGKLTGGQGGVMKLHCLMRDPCPT